jgi:hypothetical protein
VKPAEVMVIRLRKEVETELSGLERLCKEHAGVPIGHTDGYMMRARASILHDFYGGIERIFVRIAQELNGGVPVSEHWHRQLLLDMSLELKSVRPAVISRELHDLLAPFLGFRHLFRNVYGFVMEGERLDRLDARFDEAFLRLQEELRLFLDWLVPPGSAIS